MDTVYFIAQALGFLALGLGVYAYSQKDDRRLIILMIIQNAVLCLHFAMLGRATASFMTGLLSLRNLISLQKGAKALAPLFIIFYLVFGYASYEDWQDILPPINSCLTTIAYFYMRGISMRLIFLFVSLSWLIHNIVSGSYGPAIMEAFLLLANFRTIYLMRQDDITKRSS